MYGGDDSLFTTGDATAKNDDKDKYYFKQEAFGQTDGDLIIANQLPMGDPKVRNKLTRLHNKHDLKEKLVQPKIRNSMNLTLEECG